jgi:type IV pilus assembly protein PilC
MFVMPRFVTLYSDFGAELPAPTRFLFFIVSNIKYIIPALIAACMAFVFMLKTAGRQSKIKYKFAEIQLRLPFVAAIIEPLENASLARTLFTLLSGGMPLADAFETASGTIKNAFYSSRLENVRLKVNSGIGFAAAAASENLFPPTAIKLLEAGESSGTMPAMLGEIASYYEQIAENRINSIMTIIEPTLIFLTGILVGGVVIIMYLPVFQLTEIVK